MQAIGHLSPNPSNYPTFTYYSYNALDKDFPQELILIIFRHLNMYELVQAKRTCKRLYRLSKDSSLTLSHFNIFKNSKAVKIHSSLYSIHGFLTYSHYMIKRHKNLPDNTAHLLQIDMISKKTTELLPPNVHCIEMIMLEDYSYLVYLDSYLGLRISPKNDSTGEGIIFNLSEMLIIPYSKDFVYHVDQILTNQKDIIAIRICDNILCFKKNKLLYFLEPYKETLHHLTQVTQLTLSNSLMLVTYSSCHHLTHRLYDLNKQQLMSEKKHYVYCDVDAIRSCTTTKHVIIFRKWKNQLHMDVYDLTFNLINTLQIELLHCSEFEISRLRCYFFEDRVCCFCPNSFLSFHYLTTGQMVARHIFKKDDSYEMCFHSFEESVVISKKRSLEIYNIFSGTLMACFDTFQIPEWIEFRKDNDLFILNFQTARSQYTATYKTITERKSIPLLSSLVLKSKEQKRK